MFQINKISDIKDKTINAILIMDVLPKQLKQVDFKN